ncbi:DUF6804 family protein [Luteimicrobium sp. NPDC057192]|uniref:DUF6804 family protein n=1 Tax=Luteimicrobium sp. NPDC057192 TaxID=3346042 RepID=UPI00362F8AED
MSPNPPRRPSSPAPGNRPGGRPADRYGDDGTLRSAFVPGVLGGIAALVGTAFAESSSGFTVVRYVVAILALIMIVFAVQAKAFVWVVPLAAIAVLWNPVVDFDFHGTWWGVVQVLAAVVLVLAGVRIKVPASD